jgi:acetolactate synthase small subunit
MLLSVACTPEKRPELLALIEMFNGKVVDIGAKFVMVEVAGPESKVEAFIESCSSAPVPSPWHGNPGQNRKTNKVEIESGE